MLGCKGPGVYTLLSASSRCGPYCAPSMHTRAIRRRAKTADTKQNSTSLVATNNIDMYEGASLPVAHIKEQFREWLNVLVREESNCRHCGVDVAAQVYNYNDYAAERHTRQTARRAPKDTSPHTERREKRGWEGRQACISGTHPAQKTI